MAKLRGSRGHRAAGPLAVRAKQRSARMPAASMAPLKRSGLPGPGLIFSRRVPHKYRAGAVWTLGMGSSRLHHAHRSGDSHLHGVYLQQIPEIGSGQESSLQSFFRKEQNGLEKGTCELHLFSNREDNFIYSVIFRNLCNYGMRHAANCMYLGSELRAIGRTRARGDCESVASAFIFTPYPRAIEFRRPSKKSSTRIWPTLVQ